jgi:hypothetical protein
MLQLSEEYACGEARLRVDVHGSQPLEHLLSEMTYLNYRLASVQLHATPTEATPGLVWYPDEAQKDVRYEDDTLTLDGAWHQGEIQKIIISLLALRLEDVGLHAFHSSAIHYRDRTILFITGESNHGKTMSQIEGSRRGALVVSTETTVTDERGWVMMGSKSTFLRMRAKGTERADKPNQDVGVSKFWSSLPEFVPYHEPSNVDLVILPDIDGHYDTALVELAPFEREFQTMHSLLDYIGLKQLLAPRLMMPLIDTDERRAKRAGFCNRFAERPYYLIRARDPGIVLDEVERLL